MSAAWKLLPITLLLAVFAIGAEPPSKAQIDRWLKQLGDNDFTVREEATRKLWEAGRAAEPGLRALRKSDDAEVMRRVQEILEKFRWGLYPDTPRAMAERITRYQGGDATVKQAVVRELLDLGGEGCGVLLRIVRAEDNEEVRKGLFQQVSQEAARAVPDLLFRNDFTTLDELLELTVASDLENAVEGYAAYALLRGKLDERIAEASARAEKDGKAWQLLAQLHRAKGDLKAAGQAAAKAGKPELHQAILAEAGEWKELAKRDPEPGEGFGPLGLKATYQRLAGDHDGAEKTLQTIVQRAEDPAGQEGAVEAARCLLLNERPAEALRVLLHSKHHVTAFEVLAGQMRVREAFELADKAQKDTNDDLQVLEIRRAGLLSQIGEATKAAEVFDRVARDIPKEGDHLPGWVEELIGEEHRAGQTDRAFEHTVKALALTPTEGNQGLILEKVFAGRGGPAGVWWRFLRTKFADEKPEESMKRLRRLMAAKPDAREVEPLVREATRAAENLGPAEKESALVAAAQVSLSSGLETLGRDLLEQADKASGSTTPMVLLGDHHAAKKQWEPAGECYGRAWEKHHTALLPLFLQGWAMTQAGAVKEGRRRMDLVHWMSLGDESARDTFGGELAKRGHTEAAKREFDLLLKTSRPGSFSAGEARRRLGMDAVAAHRFADAADYHQQAVFRVLGPLAMFDDTSSYLTSAHFISTLRARAMAEAGRFDEARKLADRCLELEPANSDLAILLTPAFEKHGRKKDADELFTRSRDFLAQLVSDHPNSGWANNGLAWLCAGCRRELDLGLKHARKAVEVKPDSAGNLDTLAEIHFQRGDRDKAIELMKKCIALDGAKGYFRKQLARFEKGDRSAEVPSEDED